MNRITTGDIRVDTLIAFLRVADILDKYLEIELEHYPLSRTEYVLMIVLKLYSGRMRPTDLSNHVFRARHTISRLINSLEKKELIRREIDSQDHRSLQACLTARGWEMVEQVWLARQNIAQRAMSCFGQQEIDRIKDDLNMLREHLLPILINDKGGELQ